MEQIKKILIANRGEIAVRVMRTARELGYQTVAVYSEPDAGSLHVQLADESVLLTGLTAGETYLDISKIIGAVRLSGADAIHPGYGFLSENAEFSERCASAGITFIGPSASVIKLMGSKRLSKIAMLDAGVPCVSGYQGAEQDDLTLVEQAELIGVPLMIKASAGGGGRGMRLVHEIEQFLPSLNIARNEALSAFGSDEVILETAVIKPRHIEIQIFADKHGNVVHLGERDCSVQRRNQKVVEEAPSPFVTEELRAAMGAAAVNAAKACGYVGAGTVEFLVSEDKSFFFLEMNTRLQVEHPVTEMVTGTDLVAWQISVAAGMKLPLTQSEIELKGHAIEVRLYAEDPRNNFMPQTGDVLTWRVAEGKHYRIDSGVQTGQKVSAYYDPMLAKLIAFGDTRSKAIESLRSSLDKTVLLGINNNLRFLADILAKPNFEQGHVTTAFLTENYPDGVYQPVDLPMEDLALAAALTYRSALSSPVYNRPVWRNATILVKSIKLEYDNTVYSTSVSHEDDTYRVVCSADSASSGAENSLGSIDEQEYIFEIAQNKDDDVVTLKYQGLTRLAYATLSAGRLFLQTKNGHFSFVDQTYQVAKSATGQGDSKVIAVMDGAIVELNVAVGDRVHIGQVIGSLEAMKMIHTMKASVPGVVIDLPVTVGQQVKSRQLVASIEESD